MEAEVIKTINFDLISKCFKGSQDAQSVVRAFRILREQDFFKKIDKSDYVVWCDCGKHFRNGLFIGYLFNELKELDINGNDILVSVLFSYLIFKISLVFSTVNLNFFVEKHGKNSRDSHFSCVSRFIHNESLLKRLTSSEDIVDAIHNGQKKSNENRAAESKLIFLFKRLVI